LKKYCKYFKSTGIARARLSFTLSAVEGPLAKDFYKTKQMSHLRDSVEVSPDVPTLRREEVPTILTLSGVPTLRRADLPTIFTSKILTNALNP
jgi:hypothetical protein